MNEQANISQGTIDTSNTVPALAIPKWLFWAAGVFLSALSLVPIGWAINVSTNQSVMMANIAADRKARDIMNQTLQDIRDTQMTREGEIKKIAGLEIQLHELEVKIQELEIKIVRLQPKANK